jgi:very-short-patch-repair endonuclease
VRGVAVVASRADRLRSQARAALLGTTGTTVCGLTAARLLGLPGLPARTPDEPVHLLVPRRAGRAQRRGIVLHFSNVDPADVRDLDGMPVTSLYRTVTDLVLWSTREGAVCFLDAVLHGRLLGADDMDGIAAAMRGRRAGRRGRERLRLADGRSESALETRLRLLLATAGLPPEELQWTVEERGVPMARLDLAWPSRMLAVEADGAAVHGQPDALYRDRRRQNDLVGRGWTVLRFTWQDVVHRPSYVTVSVARHVRFPCA